MGVPSRKFCIFNESHVEMKDRFIRFLLCVVLIQSCSQDDFPEGADPNLFLGTWGLSSATLEGVDSMEMSDCTRNSRLLLYRFSEGNPTSNAEIYDYELDEMGECNLVLSLNQASWQSLATFTDEGAVTRATTLTYYGEEGDAVNLTLERDGDVLKVTGNAIINGNDTSFNRTYVKLEH